MHSIKIHPIHLLQQRAAETPDKPVLHWKSDGQWHQWNWREFWQRANQLAGEMIRCGLEPGQMIGIYAWNSPQWLLVDVAGMLARLVVVPIYPTSTTEQAAQIADDSGIRWLFTGVQQEFDRALPLLDGCVEQLVPMSKGIDIRSCPAARPLGNLISPLSEVLQEQVDLRIEQVQLSDLATLIYTSGTTGVPKGVMLDFENMSDSFEMHDKRLKVGKEDLTLSFLPLSHVYERAWAHYILTCGGEVATCADPKKVGELLPEIKPTTMCAVPRFLEKVCDGIQAKAYKAGGLKMRLFKKAMADGLLQLEHKRKGTVDKKLNFRCKIWDKLVFQKVRQALGGRLRMVPCGGARLDPEVQSFFMVLGIPVKIGYGLTETLATVCCTDDGNWESGHVGFPLPGIDVRIGENDEIIVRGGNVMRGYFKRKNATDEVMKNDWFHTGDCGYFDKQGRLVLTDRIKELMKTSGGKYIAPQRIEGQVARGDLIEQVAIIAEARNFVSALIVPAWDSLEDYAKSVNIKYHDRLELLKHTHIMDVMEQRLEELQKGLARFEKIRKFTLVPHEFSIELGEITPTLKLRRKVIMKKFRKEIEAMYEGVRFDSKSKDKTKNKTDPDLE
ncbi:AMP-dependent synthetase/ligase [Pelagibaculum spongiae]|uniref:Long-chain fatty acid--CoA ligase n=1 Tax=Pelagibaculum spongiae TaxID=2080658 RepID=A0A2V1GNJ4_9GAMM|nr:long-chain fatty acid--CoA ligase [Pelagibaculum spongiae]PVZ63897.1 long-chain fatty acid--CoA ligase [Pelagibaculum spongiae]